MTAARRPATPRRALGLGLALAAACGAPRGGGAAGADPAILQLTSNVADAQVFVDGRFVAPLAALRGGLALPPGPHRIELRRDDYVARYLEIELARGRRTPLSVELSPILP